MRRSGSTNGQLVWANSPKAGFALMRAEDVAGLTQEQIASKYALPQVPTKIAEVRLAPGTKLGRLM